MVAKSSYWPYKHHHLNILYYSTASHKKLFCFRIFALITFICIQNGNIYSIILLSVHIYRYLYRRELSEWSMFPFVFLNIHLWLFRRVERGQMWNMYVKYPSYIFVCFKFKRREHDTCIFTYIYIYKYMYVTIWSIKNISM